MLQSKLFYKTTKDLNKAEGDIGLQLLTKGDFIERLASGIYSFLPLGWRVMRKIENVIRREMLAIEAQEVFLPSLQPKVIWEQSGRWNTMEPPLFKLQDQHKKEFALGPTHEEVITKIARTRIHSYKNLPVYLFQIQTKFRNELRSTGGLLRTREFLMKDLYSFHAEEKDLENYYYRVVGAYEKIFQSFKLNALKVNALSGSIGGKSSHEFMVPSELGEDRIFICPKCGAAYSEEYLEAEKQEKVCNKCKEELELKTCVEIAHIFNLGDKYSSNMSLSFLDRGGEKQNALMGCYGIGLGRILATIVIARHDEKGIIWPEAVAPFKVHVLNLNLEKKDSRRLAQLAQKLEESGVEVLYDDREEVGAGQKLVEADLIGCPIRIVGSPKTMEKNMVEIKKRKEEKVEMVRIEKAKEYIVEKSEISNF